MIAEMKSVHDVWKRLPTEEDARRFLEEIIWGGVPRCPHCVKRKAGVGAIRGPSARPGLYQCRDCRKQFTVTTKTPLHSTKLELRTWIAAMYLVITSSKGISSVVMARIIGVSQPTAWKLGHAIREMTDQYGVRGGFLSGTVEVDEAYVGGDPKYQRGKKKSKPGKGTSKPQMLVAVERGGEARARLIPSSGKQTIGPIVRAWVDPSSTLMTDGGTAHPGVGEHFAEHNKVIHKREYVNRRTGAHINTAEAFNGQVKRALIGVYHQVDRQHLQAYINEIAWRWNRRQYAGARNRSGHLIWTRLPVVQLLAELIKNAPGRQLRRSEDFGIRRPD